MESASVASQRPAPAATTSPVIQVPNADALALGAESGVLVTLDGEVSVLYRNALATRLEGPPLLLCHARAVARRCGRDSIAAFDLLELFAFVHPARFCLPTPRGLAAALGLPKPDGLSAAAASLPAIAAHLLRTLAAPAREEASDPVALAWVMGKGGWPWAPTVLAALGRPHGPSDREAARALQVWHRLPEWVAEAPPPPPGSDSVIPRESRARLAAMLGDTAEPRPQQADYASGVTAAFTPREIADAPQMVVAEAGTGVGKTLGYLAPASLWAEKNKAPVWISTYTRNLQQQIDGELDRLYPERLAKAGKVVIRKGRENYLCLLNLEEASRAVALMPRHAPALGLMARWVAATRSGDMTGGDFPGWLPDLIGRGRSLGLSDRRGECVYSACPHYSKCFIERSVRRARRADMVVANHALVMVQAALGGMDDTHLPTRYVFDEGHHLFDAADSAFALHLTGLETAELRRWLIGAEGGRRQSRARGLRRRLEGLIEDLGDTGAAIDAVESAARALPGEGWAMRVATDQVAGDGEGLKLGEMEGEGPSGVVGPAEAFLVLVRRQVLARAPGKDGPFSLECPVTDPVPGLLDAAARLDAALGRLQKPLTALASALRSRLEEEAEQLDSNTRQRFDSLARGLDRRGRIEVSGWRAMLANLRRASQPPEPQTVDGNPGTPAEPTNFVDWLGIEREHGRDVDLGYYRHWVDPTRPFAEVVVGPAHGVVVTSATLTDGTGDPDQDWQVAEARTGAAHLLRPAVRAGVPSPFDYGGQTRVLVVRDVRKDDLDQVASAYRALFAASRGGGLGLFTAIARLRGVHTRIAATMEQAAIPLYAQHVDGMDVSTLIRMFRAEEAACLLGTDAVRDGVDVPGRSLRIIVFDRVPWPRPSLLHKARREAFGGRAYDDMLTRLRLKQAYGRLIRRADDIGIFVLLDPMIPSRLFGAFPSGVTVERVGLAEAVDITETFLIPTPAG